MIGYSKGVAYDATLAERHRKEERSSSLCHIFQREFRDEFVGGWSEPGLQILCKPTEAREIVFKLLNVDDRASDSIGRDFLSTIGGTIALHGELNFQLTTAETDNTPYFMPLMPGSLSRVGNLVFQIVPRPADFPDIRRLDPRSVYTMSQQFVTPRSWRHHILAMIALDRSSSLAMLKAEGNRYRAFYNFGEHQLSCARAVLGEMSFIEWPMPRVLRSAAMSDHYYAVKAIRFRLKVRLIRQRVIAVVNQVLKDAGEAANFEAIATFTDSVPTETLTDLDQRLVAGTADPLS